MVFFTECVTQAVVSKARADGRSGMWDPGKGWEGNWKPRDICVCLYVSTYAS